MKSLLFLVGFLVAINAANSYYTSGYSESPISNTKYVQYLKERSQIEKLRRSFETLCPNHDEELDEALMTLKQCSDEIDEDTETACSAIKNHFLRCSKSLIQLFEKCLPDESKDIPRLVFEGIDSGVSYLCKTDGEHIFELANTCVFKSNLRSMRCERRLRTKMQQYKTNAPSKSEICELAQSMRPCIHNHLQDSCGNKITREAFSGFFDALLVPCKFTSNKVENNGINEVELLA